tara:strand:- start:1429 stop:1779 length:351 start_codon:yes stop_codon:yes gene_type:complete
MSDQNIRGDASYLNNNKQKTEDKHPDFKGNLILTEQQLAALVAIYEKASEDNSEAILQIDIAGWKRVSKDDGKAYIYLTNEVYTGERKPRNKNAYSFNSSSYGNKEKSKEEDSGWL